jgi:hypothetical protein
MVAVVFGAVLFWVFVFFIYFTAQGISPLEFFFGAYEPHDPELARWRALGTDPGSGLVREERLLLLEQKSAYLEHQVRYRDPATEHIVQVEPSSKVRRPRSRSVRP